MRSRLELFGSCKILYNVWSSVQAVEVGVGVGLIGIGVRVGWSSSGVGVDWSCSEVVEYSTVSGVVYRQ